MKIILIVLLVICISTVTQSCGERERIVEDGYHVEKVHNSDHTLLHYLMWSQMMGHVMSPMQRTQIITLRQTYPNYSPPTGKDGKIKAMKTPPKVTKPMTKAQRTSHKAKVKSVAAKNAKAKKAYKAKVAKQKVAKARKTRTRRLTRSRSRYRSSSRRR